jgi:hypothetical protein
MAGRTPPRPSPMACPITRPRRTAPKHRPQEGASPSPAAAQSGECPLRTLFIRIFKTMEGIPTALMRRNDTEIH